MPRRFVFALIVYLLTLNNGHGSQPGDFDCRFDISEGQQSIRSFALNTDVYRCFKHLNHRDLSIVNSEQQAVPFRIDDSERKVDKESYVKNLSFYQEPPASAFKTGDQIRRIARLTDTGSNQVSNAQWQNINIHYSSIIIEQQEANDRLQSLTIFINDKLDTVHATVVLEISDDLQRWTTAKTPQHLLFLDGDNQSLISNTLKLDSYRNAKYIRLAALSNIEKFTQHITSIEAEYQSITRAEVDIQWLKSLALQSGDKANEWVIDISGLIPISRLRFTLVDDIVFYQGAIYLAPYTSPELEKSPGELRDEGKKKLKSLLKNTVQSKSSPGRGGTKSWRYITGFNQYRIQSENETIQSADIRFNRLQSERYLFKFSQPENLTENQLPTIEAGWQPPIITFIAQGKGPFYLLAGNSKIPQKVSFPVNIASQNSHIESVKLKTKTSLADAISAVGDQADSDPQNEIGEIILWIVLLVGVALMLVMAYQLSRQMNRKNDY